VFCREQIDQAVDVFVVLETHEHIGERMCRAASVLLFPQTNRRVGGLVARRA
jgi:hypothetical protein